MDKLLELLNKEKKQTLVNQPNISINEDGCYNVFLNVTSDVEIKVNISKGKDVTIYEYINYCNNVKVNYDLNIEENSKLTVISLYSSKNCKPVINAKTNLCENAYCSSMKLFLFGSEIEYTSNTLLLGKKANINDYNVVINNSGLIQKYVMNCIHENVETTSQMRNYVICKGSSTINIDTNGHIKQGMKESNISQKTKGILLSRESGISANPLLLIDEYDCLASHGAGIGAIDEEDLFYLMSRGLTREESEELIIGGFVNPIYKAYPEEIKEYIIEIVSKYL
ncbi:MAG: SufD family Fe-S cluster assembly protein [Bacilli bacterium]|nr:SufD family Fe-S cluster assembly protein [Bacilli bacterium]OLA09045.1 MAG: hypothetical protein BHW12_04635 [Coprobacillus sp. 28_7]